MHTAKLQTASIPIQYIDNPAALTKLCILLRDKTAFAFDTEFDRFYREYGFKLSLLQIFTGEECYLIDPIALKDLQPLWVLFENPHICKVAYSCSEDIQLLKVNGCNPKNIYDIQIAAKFSNCSANSLADLLLQEFNFHSDKSMQRSNWRRRPLQPEQITYAGNDVSRLLRLKEIIESKVTHTHIARMIAEENLACEHIQVTEFKVKLSHNQKRKYNAAQQKSFMNLLLLRNEVAMEYNVPPANIVSDTTLENIFENKSAFLQFPFSKGFTAKMADDHKNKKRFTEIIENINEVFTPVKQIEKNQFPESKKETNITANEFENKYSLLYNEITGNFGKEAGEYILRGFRKLAGVYPLKLNTLKQYQRNIISEACGKLHIDFSKK